MTGRTGTINPAGGRLLLRRLEPEAAAEYSGRFVAVPRRPLRERVARPRRRLLLARGAEVGRRAWLGFGALARGGQRR